MMIVLLGNCPTIPVSTGYAHLPGTSMASPHVAGVVALMKEKNKTLSPEQIETLLCNNAEDLGPLGRDEKYGCGFCECRKIIAAVPQLVETMTMIMTLVTMMITTLVVMTMILVTMTNSMMVFFEFLHSPKKLLWDAFQKQ